MNSANKQMALKGALLVILAANVGSFGPGHKSKPLFHTTELARMAPQELGSNGGGGGSGVIPHRQSSDSIPVLKIAPPPVQIAGPRPDAPITTSVVGVKESMEYKEICSVKFKIHFIQKVEGTKTVVHAYVSQRFPQADFPGLLEEGTYQDLIADASSKAQWDETINDTVVSKLKTQGKTCSNEVASDKPSTHSTTDQDSRDSEKAARDLEIALGERNCTLDENAHPLKNSEKYECNLKRLEKISLDRTNDEDQDDDSGRDSQGRRTRRQRHQRSSGLAEVQSALRPLETSIKSLLLSSNQDKQDDGADRLDDVISSLESVRDTASNSNDERAMTKLIKNLRESYTLGAKVNREGDAYANRIDAIDDKITDLRTSMVGANQYQQYAINQQMQALMTQRLNTQQLVNTNPDYATLRAYSQNGIMDQSDFTDFAADYNQLLQQIQGSGPAGSMTSPFAPSNILAMRQQAQANDYRNYGLTNPAFPQINYAQLGLANPSLAGGPTPLFNPNGQQQSGFPVNQGFPNQFGNNQQFPNQFGNNQNLSTLTPAQQIAQMNGGVNNQSIMNSQPNRSAVFAPNSFGQQQPMQFRQQPRYF